MKKLFKILLFSFFLFACKPSFAQDIPKWKISDLEQYIRQTDTPLIVNFWATFCLPCIEEIPYFQKLAKQYDSSGLQLLLVSLDFEESYSRIKPFADKRNFAAPIVYLDETYADYFCPKIDKKWSGAIPATLLVNNKTGYRKFFEDQIPEQKLEQEIKKLIQQ